jgi:hypothetical protein
MYFRSNYTKAFILVLFLIAYGFLTRTSLAAAPPDVVLYASDVTTIRGAWTRTSSTTGAGGQRMTSTEAGWSATSAPFATPQNYFEATFSAEANTPYHVWLRLRAASNSKASDSVWVQFSDALNTTGTPVWRTGSSSGLAVNLEACSGCGVAGWGWSDGAWWTGNYSVVKFATRGTRTIRVQTREDGVQVDQIILSAGTYFNAGPGGATNDSTIVPKPSATTSPVASEVVLYAGGATRRSGNWALETDATAAYGKRQGSTDYGWAATTAPLAAPADFIEWTFNAVAGTRYHTWLRLRAANNSLKNDSVWLQFSDSVNKTGVATYRIGGVSGLPIALEPCSGCAVSGWGWQSRGWWVADTGDVYFPTTGAKTLRIQTREDGVAIDQIVLSPVRFASTPPGLPRDDTTLVKLDGTTALITGTVTLPSTTARTLTFTASADHALVLSYKLDIFKQGVNPSTGVPSGTLSVGKPTVANGQISVDISSTVQALASGTYVATVSAVGSAGSTRSAASPAFTR